MYPIAFAISGIPDPIFPQKDKLRLSMGSAVFRMASKISSAVAFGLRAFRIAAHPVIIAAAGEVPFSYMKALSARGWGPKTESPGAEISILIPKFEYLVFFSAVSRAATQNTPGNADGVSAFSE